MGSSPVREHKADNDIAGARAQSGQGIAGAWHKAGAAQQQQGIYSRQRGSSAMGGKREMMGREKGGGSYGVSEGEGEEGTVSDLFCLG